MSRTDKPKPIREIKIGTRSIERPVYLGPITPRLREREPKEVIGFIAPWLKDRDEI